MKTVAIFIFSLGIFSAVDSLCAETHEDTYGIHLYFDEKEFVDEMTLFYSDGSISGRMHVPNDFDGDLENLVIHDNTFSFDLFVPRNTARPTDLVFHYEGQFFDESRDHLIGFVRIKTESGFVASFIGFKRKK